MGFKLTGLIGWGLHPPKFDGTITVCTECFPAGLRLAFDALYGGDAFGEIHDWTVDDEDPVYCDGCGVMIYAGWGASL